MQLSFVDVCNGKLFPNINDDEKFSLIKRHPEVVLLKIIFSNELPKVTEMKQKFYFFKKNTRPLYNMKLLFCLKEKHLAR